MSLKSFTQLIIKYVSVLKNKKIFPLRFLKSMFSFKYKKFLKRNFINIKQTFTENFGKCFQMM